MKKLIISLIAAVVAVSAIAAMNYVQPSGSVTLTALADVASGDIVTVGSSSLVGVAMGSAPSNGTFVAYTTGIFAFPEAATNDVAVGTTLYKAADSAAAVSIETNSDVRVGIAVGTAPNGDILVDLNR